MESCHDVRRSLSKMHLSVNCFGVTDKEVLARKALSLMITDANTPIIKQLCQIMRNESGALFDRAVKDMEKLSADEVGYVARAAIMDGLAVDVKNAIQYNLVVPSTYPPCHDTERVREYIRESLGLEPDAFAALERALDQAVLKRTPFKDLKLPPIPGLGYTVPRDLFVGDKFFHAGDKVDEHGVVTPGVPKPPPQRVKPEVPTLPPAVAPPPWQRQPNQATWTRPPGAPGFGGPVHGFKHRAPNNLKKIEENWKGYQQKPENRGFGNNRRPTSKGG